MITQGLFNVEFSMPGHFGEGAVVIDDPSLLTDALAQFARIQRETADILEIPYAANPEAASFDDPLVFGWHRAEIIVIPAKGGPGLDIVVSCNTGLQLTVKLVRVGD